MWFDKYVPVFGRNLWSLPSIPNLAFLWNILISLSLLRCNVALGIDVESEANTKQRDSLPRYMWQILCRDASNILLLRSSPSHVPATVRSSPSHVPATVRSGKYLDILHNETGLALRSVSKGSEKLAPIRIRTPKHPSLRQSLCRLSYCGWLIKRAHWSRYSFKDQGDRHRTELFS